MQRKKHKQDPLILTIIFYLMIAVCVLGASGCIFDDVVSEEGAVAMCALIGACIVVYALKCLASYSEDFS